VKGFRPRSHLRRCQAHQEPKFLNSRLQRSVPGRSSGKKACNTTTGAHGLGLFGGANVRGRHFAGMRGTAVGRLADYHLFHGCACDRIAVSRIGVARDLFKARVAGDSRDLMRTAVGHIAPVAEPIAEAGSRERLAKLGHQEGQMATGVASIIVRRIGCIGQPCPISLMHQSGVQMRRADYGGLR
jgi:hypothetical protein